MKYIYFGVKGDRGGEEKKLEKKRNFRESSRREYKNTGNKRRGH